MKLKVLPNDLQDYLNSKWLKMKHGDSYDPNSDSLLDPIVGRSKHAERIIPVYNRVGWYQTKERCWYEWQLPSGKMVATVDTSSMFDYKLKQFMANENALSNKEWDMINHLCNRGIIETNEKIQAEGLRRISRRQEIDNKIRIKHMKARIRAKIEEKKNAEQ